MKPNLLLLELVQAPLKAVHTFAASELNKQKHPNGLCETSTADLSKENDNKVKKTNTRENSVPFYGTYQ